MQRNRLRVLRRRKLPKPRRLKPHSKLPVWLRLRRQQLPKLQVNSLLLVRRKLRKQQRLKQRSKPQVQLLLKLLQ